MELAISAITGDLTSRFITFLMNEYSNYVFSEEKMKRLQKLLLRVHTVIEEADGRYITNSFMLIQLKTLVAAMYQGYHVLDTINYRQRKEVIQEELVSDSSPLSVSARLKRYRKNSSTATKKIFKLELQGVLENLESLVANIMEFVVLLGGCERISRKPYDTYLHLENFMFGRHVEKQQLISFLLQDDTPGPPAVLPVIGRRGVGKKTLAAHVCNDERVHSHFSSILHLNGGDIFRIKDHERLPGRALVVVEFISDVDDDVWTTFYSYITCMVRGSKVIILSTNKKLEKFGTVKPISLNCLAYEEYRYLFKKLAFGSANPTDYPDLVRIVEEFATLLGGSLISANLLADALRKNLNVHFWLCKLNAMRTTVRNSKNMSIFSLHPQVFFYRGHPVHFVLSPLQDIPNVPKKDLPRIILGDLLAGHIVPPEGNYSLISWESRLLPYTSFVHLVHIAPKCTIDDNPEKPLSGRKRPGIFA